MFNKTQQVFCLSILANLPSGKKGTQAELQEDMQKDLHKVLTDDKVIGDIGKWDVVWGPVVHVPPHGKASANATYIAKSAADNRYVIATAGTNGISAFGWFTEDFKVRKQYSWPYYKGVPSGLDPKIAEGTSIGLHILSQTMTSDGQNIQQFLAGLLRSESRNVEIVVTGHSLGGALSPALALLLVDTQSDWDPQGKATVSVEPSAGASPGNADFSAYYDSRLGDRTNRIWNALDVVPHSWNTEQLHQIPDLYQPELSSSLSVRMLANFAAARSKKGNYLQLLPKTKPFQSKFNPKVDDKSKSKTKRFISQMLFQHIDAYFIELGVEGFVQYITELTGGKQSVVHGGTDPEGDAEHLMALARMEELNLL